MRTKTREVISLRNMITQKGKIFQSKIINDLKFLLSGYCKLDNCSILYKNNQKINDYCSYFDTSGPSKGCASFINLYQDTKCRNNI